MHRHTAPHSTPSHAPEDRRAQVLAPLARLLLAAHRPLGPLAAAAIHLAAPTLAILGFSNVAPWVTGRGGDRTPPSP